MNFAVQDIIQKQLFGYQFFWEIKKRQDEPLAKLNSNVFPSNVEVMMSYPSLALYPVLSIFTMFAGIRQRISLLSLGLYTPWKQLILLQQSGFSVITCDGKQAKQRITNAVQLIVCALEWPQSACMQQRCLKRQKGDEMMGKIIKKSDGSSNRGTANDYVCLEQTMARVFCTEKTNVFNGLRQHILLNNW